ncbi:hypothetical protein OsJ_31666 [Oryza sativa Japonica Group]|uniref:HMA domain-containing protein n=1 Tax=Oryza sativa subsp. japonica TaxID=39947 RepID=B9G5X7_ORYSJ|nr:hypothetical protein OsJ_31666 [Oryza sativa Japonica Group]
MAPATVILEMEVHCNGCARKIEKTIKKISVSDVLISFMSMWMMHQGWRWRRRASGRRGRWWCTAPPTRRRSRPRLKAKIKRDVAIVSITAGAVEPPQQAPPAAAPPQQAAPPDAPPHQYGGDYRQHGSGNSFRYPPSYFSDENPSGCSIQ